MSLDPFATLGLDPAFDLDLGAAERRFRELSRVVHPDRFAGAASGERRRALGKAVDVNEAWRKLRDPIARAEALLRRRGVEVNEGSQPRASQALLIDFMELREQLAEARERRERAVIGALADAVKSREEAALARLREGFARLTDGDPQGQGPALLSALGELRYVRRFLDEVRAIEEDLGLKARGPATLNRPRPPGRGQENTMVLLDIFDPKAPLTPIGIDLGTTNSLVAYVSDGRPCCLKDCDGAALLPSVVHYSERGSVVVGSAAASLAVEAPQETIVSVKRFMGRGARDPETKKLGPYRFVEPASDDEAKVVRFGVRGRALTPVEVSAEILRALRQRADDELRGVGGVVITVPAYFDDAQRQATKDAGRLAGLDVLRLLNEPTAAALAYGLEKKKNGKFAVYDLGGGTFDITILDLDDGVFEVRSTGGDSALGGDDFDRALAEAVLLPAMGAGEPGHQSPALVRLAIDAAKQIKHGLTDAAEVAVELPVRGGGSAQVLVTREQFEKLIAPLVERTGVACRRALRDASTEPGGLDGVILVGGSTRVPLVRRFVAQLFQHEPLGDIDPDEVVALGAAVLADMLGGEGPRDEALLLDVLPLSLGIETMGGVVDKVLPRNTTIPTAARSTFTTYADGQTGFDIHVVQGEREFAADNRSLARFTLKGIPPMPAGMARLEVNFEVDQDNLLRVSAREVTTGIEQRVEVKPSYGLTDEQVEEMLIGALDHGEDDLSARQLAEKRVEAQRVLMATDKALAADGALLEADERARITAALDELRRACEGKSAALIHGGVERLDDATRAWAGRRMDAAIARAIAGKQLGDVEASVAHAKGVEAHLAEERG